MQMNCAPVIDTWMAKEMETLRPHMNVPSDEEPRALSDVVLLPKPVVSTIQVWHTHQEEPMEQRHWDFLNELCEA